MDAMEIYAKRVRTILKYNKSRISDPIVLLKVIMSAVVSRCT